MTEIEEWQSGTERDPNFEEGLDDTEDSEDEDYQPELDLEGSICRISL